MTTRFWCARCGRSYEVPLSLAGRRVRCRACGHVQTIPAPAEPTPADTRPIVIEPGPVSSTYDLGPPSAPAAVPRPVRAALVPLTTTADRSTRTGRRLDAWREHLRAAVTEAGQLQELSLVLLVLSITDLFVTHTLLRTSPHFYESNPVALWIFRRWNIAGMTIFKFTAIGVAIALGEVIERRRPGWGKAVLVIGCVAAGAVVWHGLKLYLGFEPMPVAGGD